MYLFYFYLVALGFHCYVQAFSSCGEQGLLFVLVCELLIVETSLLVRTKGSRHPGFSSWSTQAQKLWCATLGHLSFCSYSWSA